MKQVMYCLQFVGTGTPKDGDVTVLAVRSTAASASMRTAIGAAGVTGGIDAADGGKAEFESIVAMNADGSFDENGSIRFGSAGSLRFSTVGRGTVSPSPQAGVNAGAVIWKIESGEGQFDGATGFITSNFQFNEAGEVTDNQFGVIWLK